MHRFRSPSAGTQMEQSSSAAPPPHVPVQSGVHSMVAFATQAAHLSSTPAPLRTPLQSVQVALSPPHMPHASATFPLLGTPSQPWFMYTRRT